MRRFHGFQVTFWLCLLILTGFTPAGHGETPLSPSTQDGQQDRSTRDVENQTVSALTVSALLVSDIHFDPFHDPAKVQQLVEAPVGQWSAILSAPSSTNQQQAFADLQRSCHALGVDTPYSLLRSGLQAMEYQQPDVKFITVSGDLIAHSFSCRYKTLFPGSAQSDYQSFVLKTLSFVMGALRAGFPDAPIYAVLGNNDSVCDDNRLDRGSDFLSRAGGILVEGLPPSQRQQALQTFAKGGYYSLTMGAPMRNTRLLVVNDVYLSPKYRTCAGEPDPAAVTAEMAWLQEELAKARQLGQSVWVMGHIPPGIDPFATVREFKAICGNQTPEMFLSSDVLADLLTQYADVIRLGVFAHSHMDEMRLLESPDGEPRASFEHSVALKMVPSISPVDGNDPSFTVARVDPSSAVLKDYEVIAASNQTGVAATWSREYDYAESYHEAQFSPSAVKELITEFADDRGAKTQVSQDYIRSYFVGDRSPELKPFWPQYTCALANHTAKAFAACLCSTGK
jgi:sphingomyelin phosphodiesterase acid-like 3